MTGTVQSTIYGNLYKTGLEDALIVAANDLGHTALHIACYRVTCDPNIATVKCLVESGGGEELVNKQDEYGHTALHQACGGHANPKVQVVIYLVEHGGGKELVNKQDNDGETAWDLIPTDPTNDAVRNFLKNFHGESLHYTIV